MWNLKNRKRRKKEYNKTENTVRYRKQLSGYQGWGRRKKQDRGTG